MQEMQDMQEKTIEQIRREEDGKADAFAGLALISLFVVGCWYWVAGL